MGNQFEIKCIPYASFQSIIQSGMDHKRLQLLADMCRYNTLSSVKLAGSGHLGSSLSAIDINTFLYFSELNVLEKGIDNPDRDVYFSSKGHDCPGQYAVLMAAGIISFEKMLKLRRLGGLDGHPDVKIPGMEICSGSLGMGISKAKGFAIGKKLAGDSGRVVVLTGDGELQEGQIWESLQTASHQKISNIICIVDLNKIQSDKETREIIELKNLEKKFESFGWYVQRCEGHDYDQLQSVFDIFDTITDRPKVLIADTVKGKGISFMEGPVALKDNNGIYKWHSGAPADDVYLEAVGELSSKIKQLCADLSVTDPEYKLIERRDKNVVRLKDKAEKVVTAYEQALVKLGKQRSDLVVLDADLCGDCGLKSFEREFPDRFIENGIAEQDMVSAAGGLALQGFLPVVNSFGVFLASRSNEQIYANSTENTKIIYVCHYAGLIPAGPGKSHQSLRDISLFGALNNITIIEPCNAQQTEDALFWSAEHADGSCMIRLIISPSPQNITLPTDYRFSKGHGSVLLEGTDALIIAYGPVMLNEALKASDILAGKSVSLKVVNMPWLNNVDTEWLKDVSGGFDEIIVIDNHMKFGGLGQCVANVMMSDAILKTKKITQLGIDCPPACGTPQEVLQYHGLDAQSLADLITSKKNTALKI